MGPLRSLRKALWLIALAVAFAATVFALGCGAQDDDAAETDDPPAEQDATCHEISYAFDDWDLYPNDDKLITTWREDFRALGGGLLAIDATRYALTWVPEDWESLDH